jgi:hypothetical protein
MSALDDYLLDTGNKPPLDAPAPNPRPRSPSPSIPSRPTQPPVEPLGGPPTNTGREIGGSRPTTRQPRTAPSEARTRNNETSDLVNKFKNNSSLAKQFGKELTELPGAVMGLAKSFSMLPFNMAGYGIDVAQGQKGPWTTDGDFGSKFTDVTRDFVPLAHQIGSSFVRTANVPGIGQQENIINRYKTASDEGRTVGTFFEDIGNAAIVLGGAGAVAGRTASGAGAAARVGRFKAPQTRGSGPRAVANPSRVSVAGDLTKAARSGTSVSNPPRFKMPGDHTIRSLSGDPVTLRGVPVESLRGTPYKAPGNAVPGASNVIVQPGKGSGIAGRLEAGGRMSAAAKVETVGNYARAGSIGAEWLDPATPMMRVGGSITGAVAKPFVRGAAKALNTTFPNMGSNFDAFIERQQKRVEARSEGTAVRAENDRLDTKVKKAQISNLDYLYDKIGKLVPKTEKVVAQERWGAVVLSATDLNIDAVADLIRTIENDVDIPDSVIDSQIAALNEGKPEGTGNLTRDTFKAYEEYRSGELRTSNPDLWAVIDETVQRSKELSAETSAVQIRVGNVHTEQMDVPIRPDLDGDGNQIMDDDGKLVGTALTDLSPEALRQAFEDDNVHIPYKQTWLERERGKLNDQAAALGPTPDEMVQAAAEGRVLPTSKIGSLTEARDRALVRAEAGEAFGSVAPETFGTIGVLSRALDRAIELVYEYNDEFTATGVKPDWAVGEALIDDVNIAEQALREAETMVEPPPTPLSLTELVAMSKKELLAEATKNGIVGRHAMRRGQLTEALKDYADDVAAEAVDAVVADASTQAGRQAILENNLRRAEQTLQVAVQTQAGLRLEAANLESTLDVSLQTHLTNLSGGANKTLRALVLRHSPAIGRLDGKHINGVIGRVARTVPGGYDKLVEVATQLRDENTAANGGVVDNSINYASLAAEGLFEQGRRAGLIGDGPWLDYNKARVSEILAEVMDDVIDTGSSQMMDGFTGYRALRTKINELQGGQHREPGFNEDMAKAIDVDLLNKIDSDYNRFVDRFNRQLKDLNSARLAASPAAFRTVLQEAQRSVIGMMEDAQRYWDQGDIGGADIAAGIQRIAMDAPTSFLMYAQQGRATPSHLTGGPLSGSAGISGALDNSKVKIQNVRSSSARDSSARLTSLKDYSNLMAREMTRVSRNQGVLAVANSPRYSSSIYDILGEAGPGGQLSFLDQWRKDHGTFGEQVSMKDIEVELNARGYSIVWGGTPTSTRRLRTLRWDVETPSMRYNDNSGMPREGRMATTGDGTLQDLDVPLPDIDAPDFPDIRVVPIELAKQLNDFQNPQSGFYVTMFDQMTQMWKTAQLAWSVGWVTYNAFGNVLMATIGGGMGPLELAGRINDVRKQFRQIDLDAGGTGKAPLRTAFRNDSLSQLMPDELGGHGLSYSEQQLTRDAIDVNFDGWQGAVAERGGKILRGMTDGNANRLGAFTEWSYNVNEFTDNLFRKTVNDHKAQMLAPAIPKDLLADDGVSIKPSSELTPDDHARLSDLNAEAAAAYETSIKQALNIMGDFTRLTPTERRVIKRIMPFYPWIRHQMQMSLRLPLNNPLRWAFIMSIADNEDESLLGDLLNTTIETPFGRIGMAPANPFGGLSPTATEGDNFSLFDPRRAMQAVSPVVKPPAELVTGLDLSNASGGSRPMDQKEATGTFGETLPQSALGRIMGGDIRGGFGETGYKLAGSTRLTKALRDTALSAPAFPGGNPRPRYDSGDVVLQADPRKQSLAQQLARIPGLPFIPRDMETQLEVAENKDRIRLRDALRAN